MREYKYSTAKGKQIYKMGQRCRNYNISEIYNKVSFEKQKAFDMCLMLYYNDENSSDFRVGNANTYAFTASWFLTKDGEKCMRVQTKKNSYLIWLDR